ncbi:hypothetical protein Ga0074812_102136 [Parafrankia irregularis]|uniref:Uncharacterized protein n=1 Tax=Parafrankia irregularis TaxID=795642 RepID=A0A0S4QF01_9ACTN|nr:MULTISPECIES: hypothetical protein [Parafrankia]CUU54132.1 hypothetical protein Ga0074812_102136 [Parafrankia irregularis]
MVEQVADGTIDRPGATHGTWGEGPADVLAATRWAARELIRVAPYGSLVLWGGRLVHGLRFAVIASAGMSTLGPGAYDLGPGGAAPTDAIPADLVMADPAPVGATHAGPVPAEPNLFEQFAAVPATRLVMLAPFSVGRLLGTEDQACRFQICGPVSADGCEWVSVALAGWVAPVPGGAVSELAQAFTDRHPTPDLLDLGSVWMLLELDLAEATVRTRSRCIQLDTADVVALLNDHLHQHEHEHDLAHARDPDGDHTAGREHDAGRGPQA